MSFFQVERRGVVEKPAGFPQEEGLWIQPGLLALLLFREHRGLCGLEHAIQPAQDSEREDDLPVFRLLVVAAQEIGDGPEEGGEIGIAQAGG
jgi:hypothetical protein